MNAQDVTAVIVTRGDIDLEPILATLPYPEVIVWNNAERPFDAKCYGRYLAMELASRDVIFHVDDDLLFHAHDELLAAYEPGKIVANMPSPWYEQASYDVLGQALPGAGSLMDRDVHYDAVDRYLKCWPMDDLFLTYADVVVGILTPHTRHDFGYTILPHASAPGRIYTSPGAAERKAEMQSRALALRGAE